MVVMMSSGFTWKLGNLLENFKNVFQWISLYHFSNIFQGSLKRWNMKFNWLCNLINDVLILFLNQFLQDTGRPVLYGQTY